MGFRAEDHAHVLSCAGLILVLVITPVGLLQTLGLRELRSSQQTPSQERQAQDALKPRSTSSFSLFPADAQNLIGDHASPAKGPSPFMDVANSQPVPAFRTCGLQEKIIYHRTLLPSCLCSCLSRHNVLWSLALPLNHHSQISPDLDYPRHTWAIRTPPH